MGSCVVLYSFAETPQVLPSPRIWAHIWGHYWLAKIDDISLWPSDWARFCKRLRSPGIGSLKSILELLKCLQIRALDRPYSSGQFFKDDVNGFSSILDICFMPEAQCRTSLCCNASPKTGSEFSGFLSVAELPTFLPPWWEQSRLSVPRGRIQRKTWHVPQLTIT